MSAHLRPRFGINRKMQIPNLVFVALLVVFVIVYFSSMSSLEQLYDDQERFTVMTGQMRQAAFDIQSYMDEALSHGQLEESLTQKGLLKKENGFGDSSADTGIMAVLGPLDKFEKIQERNRDIGTKIGALTEASIKQSQNYIIQMSRKLADEVERQKVTSLERLVISSASLNNIANYEVRVKFLGLKEDFSERESLLKYLDTLIANADKAMKDLKGTPFAQMPAEGRKANVEIKNLVLEYIGNVGRMQELEQSIRSDLTRFLDQAEKSISERNQGFFEKVQAQYGMIVVLFLLGCLLAFFLTFFIGRGISRDVSLITASAKRFSRGDIEISTEDEQGLARIHARRDELGEIGRAFSALVQYMREKSETARLVAQGRLNLDVRPVSPQDALGLALEEMVASLNKLIHQVQEAASLVEIGSTQISNSGQSLSQGTTEQASSIEQMSSTMMEIGSQIKSNAENASQAEKMAKESRATAEKGNTRMKDMVEAMAQINDSSHEIAQIIKTIDDIAFQTNLLALNAAVEAARAGKHGKGFAVVAQEVRNLAGRSAKAASETSDLIESSVHRVETGASILAETNQALEGIFELTGKVSDLVGEIAAASNEQASGLSQVNEGLGQIEKVTQTNTANAEETAASSQELRSMSVELLRAVSRFRLKNDQGGQATQVSPLRDFPNDPKTRVEEASKSLLPYSCRSADPRNLISWGDEDADLPQPSKKRS